MYKGTLIAAGLTPKQAAVYEACLEVGASSIPEIAQHAQIKRTTAYGIVEELEALGLLKSSFRGKRKLFAAQNPALMLDMLESKKKRLAEAMPELSDLFLIRNVKPKITFFEERNHLSKLCP